jgi:hypothetical protein
MIFNRTLSFKSDHQVADIKQRLLGKTVHVHNLDFEVVESNNVVKIIPHADDVVGATTLPITHVLFKSRPTDTVVRMRTHPRRIDVGGPYIVMIILAFTLLAGVALLVLVPDMYSTAGKWMVGMSLVLGGIFWIKMELGYFDYVRQLHKWLKTVA